MDPRARRRAARDHAVPGRPGPSSGPHRTDDRAIDSLRDCGLSPAAPDRRPRPRMTAQTPSPPASGRAWTHARPISTRPFSQVDPRIRHPRLPATCRNPGFHPGPRYRRELDPFRRLMPSYSRTGPAHHHRRLRRQQVRRGPPALEVERSPTSFARSRARGGAGSRVAVGDPGLGWPGPSAVDIGQVSGVAFIISPADTRTPLPPTGAPGAPSRRGARRGCPRPSTSPYVASSTTSGHSPARAYRLPRRLQ